MTGAIDNHGGANVSVEVDSNVCTDASVYGLARRIPLTNLTIVNENETRPDERPGRMPRFRALNEVE